MPRCTFCGIQIPKGTGKLYVYSSGKTANFCKSKCEKNFLGVKRKPLEVRWTEHYRKEHKKDQKTEKVEEKVVVSETKVSDDDQKPKVSDKKKVEEKPTPKEQPATEEPKTEEAPKKEAKTEEAVPKLIRKSKNIFFYIFNFLSIN